MKSPLRAPSLVPSASLVAGFLLASRAEAVPPPPAPVVIAPPTVATPPPPPGYYAPAGATPIPQGYYAPVQGVTPGFVPGVPMGEYQGIAGEPDLRTPGLGRAAVEFRSVGRPVQIRRYDGGDTMTVRTGWGWSSSMMAATRSLCTTPCTLYLSSAPFRFVAGGPGIYPSFLGLPGSDEARTVWLHGPSAFERQFGLSGTIGGAGALVLGSLFAALGATVFRGSSTSSSSSANLYIAAGSILGAAGLACLVAGAVLLSRNPVGFARPPANAVAFDPRSLSLRF